MTQYWPFAGLMRHATLRERVIVSLDLGGPREGLRMVDELARSVGMFKIGKSLFLNGGPDFVRDIRRRGGEVFLDLKFHDTPQAVSKAAVEATRLGVRMFDLHPSGSLEMMERARTEVARVCRNEGRRRPHILAVTMLAALHREDPSYGDGLHQVVQLAKRAAEASLDGVVVPAQDTASVRAACGRRFIIATSGVRLGLEGDRCCEAGSAAGVIAAGADYLVIGSPIWRAVEPLRALREILEEVERGLRANSRTSLELFYSRPR
jgi:orotidine-5'-phosphate decarboxylase